MFRLAQNLGHPKIFPPASPGKLPVALQFTIPGLETRDEGDTLLLRLMRNCDVENVEIWNAAFDQVRTEKTGNPATIVTVAFYASPGKDRKEDERRTTTISNLIVERFLGLLSFAAGKRLLAVHQQATVSYDQRSFQKILPAVSKIPRLPVKVEIPRELYESKVPSESLFSALFWLRRGLAEKDPIETYSSLMVCLQILARHLVTLDAPISKCKKCGAQLPGQGPSITPLVKELVVSRLGEKAELFEKIWKLRNAVVAHGNEIVTARTFLELTESKFDVAELAFRALRLAFGIAGDEPSPSQDFLVTDALMYVE